MTVPGSSEEDYTAFSTLLNLQRNLHALGRLSERKDDDLNIRRNEPGEGPNDRPRGSYTVWFYYRGYKETYLRSNTKNLIAPLTNERCD
jgi:hypothetical protein